MVVEVGGLDGREALHATSLGQDGERRIAASPHRRRIVVRPEAVGERAGATQFNVGFIASLDGIAGGGGYGYLRDGQAALRRL
eukprot:gene5711-36521_t